jgi:hypothetical protein
LIFSPLSRDPPSSLLCTQQPSCVLQVEVMLVHCVGGGRLCSSLGTCAYNVLLSKSGASCELLALTHCAHTKGAYLVSLTSMALWPCGPTAHLPQPMTSTSTCHYRQRCDGPSASHLSPPPPSRWCLRTLSSVPSWRQATLHGPIRLQPSY